MKKKKDIVQADTESGQLAGEEILLVVENQLKENNPSETRKTLDRLLNQGESRDNAMRHIGSALIVEVFGSLKNGTPYNEERYLKNLRALPKPPSERT